MVDGTGLENRHTLTGIGGSNPSLSASPTLSLSRSLFLVAVGPAFQSQLPAKNVSH